MKPAKIRLLEPQFLGYTGILCGIKFVDGISVAELPFVDQQRICASMRATTVEGKNVSPSAAYSSRNNLTAEDIVETPAPDIVPMKRGAAETKPKPVQRFTREELESIADCEGIAGLRQIGNQIGVKAKGIVEMIEGAHAHTVGIGAHTHSVAIGSHGHTITVNAAGNAENTVKNIAFNYIVRLA